MTMNCKLRRLDLLRNGHLSDCQVHVCYLDKALKTQCCRQFRCHKIILVSASEEFERLFGAPEFEKNKGIICVDDASPEAYETLLLYIYTSELCGDVSLEMCTELIFLANKFKMFDFMDYYIQKLASQDWPYEVVLQIFQLANQYNNKSMEVVAKKILPIAPQVLNDNSFLRLSVPELKALITVLKSEGTIPENDLLSALKKYQVCNNIRYDNMVLFKQFVEVVNLFNDTYFEVDGTLSVETVQAKPEESKGNS